MDTDGTPLQQAVAGVVTALVLTVAFGLMFAGVPYFWVAFVVGFGGVLPLAVALTRLYETRAEPAEPAESERSDALSTLRDRYARGDIDEAEFERRVEALLETEREADAAAYAERIRERERERDAE